jgi:hypothetical protein
VADRAEPTDREIEDRLAAAPADHWAQLCRAMDALSEGDDHAAWSSDPDQLPYVTYDEAASEVVGLLGAVGAVFPFDWPRWKGFERYPDPGRIDGAPVADTARLATTIVRGERFCDGTIATSLRDGTLHAVVRRLCRWYETERHSR